MGDANFKCLRCGNEYAAPFDNKNLQERTCRKCGSNSVRKLRTPPKKRGGDHQPRKDRALA